MSGAVRVCKNVFLYTSEQLKEEAKKKDADKIEKIRKELDAADADHAKIWNLQTEIKAAPKLRAAASMWEKYHMAGVEPWTTGCSDLMTEIKQVMENKKSELEKLTLRITDEQIVQRACKLVCEAFDLDKLTRKLQPKKKRDQGRGDSSDGHYTYYRGDAAINKAFYNNLVQLRNDVVKAFSAVLKQQTRSFKTIYERITSWVGSGLGQLADRIKDLPAQWAHAKSVFVDDPGYKCDYDIDEVESVDMGDDWVTGTELDSLADSSDE